MVAVTPAPLTSFSAVPLWLQQILPKYFLDRPAFTEAAYAFCKAGLYGASINIGDAASDAAFTTFPAFIRWFGTHWFMVAIAAYLAITRGQEAHAKTTLALTEAKTPTP